uniref:Uncharacterized protein n=1 Tax=Romanomermis culicivorax TaxID=13658 RepID=A0A915HJI1_ROMCU
MIDVATAKERFNLTHNFHGVEDFIPLKNDTFLRQPKGPNILDIIERPRRLSTFGFENCV